MFDKLVAVETSSSSALKISLQLLFTMRTREYSHQALPNFFNFVYNAYSRFSSFKDPEFLPVNT